MLHYINIKDINIKESMSFISWTKSEAFVIVQPRTLHPLQSSRLNCYKLFAIGCATYALDFFVHNPMQRIYTVIGKYKISIL